MLIKLHVISGIIGLLTGLSILFLKKGDKIHKKTGKVFLHSMLVSALTGLALSYILQNVFFFVVGIFTLYLVGTGSRFIYLKLVNNEKAEPKILDWVLTIAMLISGLVMIYMGVNNIIKGNNGGIILAVFGAIGLSGVWQDLKYYRGLEKGKMYWLRTHISRMVGGFIAATTAFLVNNMGHLPKLIPGYVYWLFPTILLVPLIVKWQRKYVRR